MSENAMTGQSALSWFEIPTTDFDRARNFYETVLAVTLHEPPFGDRKLAVFPFTPPGVGGCLAGNSSWAPGAGGCVVYLAVPGALDPVLARVEQAGGRIVISKESLPQGMGWVAHIIDPEGNRVGLRSSS